MAGISDARWRQIVTGYQTVGGTYIPVRAPADTLARMAQAAGATAHELADAGREDAADALRELSTAPAGQSDPQVEAITALLATLSPDAQQEVFRRLQHGVSPVTHTQAPDERHAG
ncbi:hypothetical protein ACFWC2_14225 [Streptomyces diastaticus]|uniref:hypothetical protein n=1 Tax=Streptomyces diastaticus TaxID=1956 RepID=UPI00365963DF